MKVTESERQLAWRKVAAVTPRVSVNREGTFSKGVTANHLISRSQSLSTFMASHTCSQPSPDLKPNSLVNSRAGKTYQRRDLLKWNGNLLKMILIIRGSNLQIWKQFTYNSTALTNWQLEISWTSLIRVKDSTYLLKLHVTFNARPNIHFFPKDMGRG
jgi:hypothetical protein